MGKLKGKSSEAKKPAKAEKKQAKAEHKRSAFLAKVDVARLTKQLAPATNAVDLKGLSLSLNESTSGKVSNKPAVVEVPVARSNKGKRSVAQMESAQFSAVLQHDAFQQNPFATLQTHLNNTLPPEPKSASAKPFSSQRSAHGLRARESVAPLPASQRAKMAFAKHKKQHALDARKK